MVVTSRPIVSGELDGLSTPWRSFTLLPFDETRVLQFIQNWVDHAWPSEAGGAPIEPVKLAEAWSKDPTIAPLTGNPLLLSTLLVVHKLEHGLPEGRGELYRSYVRGMIGIWGREVATPGVTLSDEQKRVVLTDLALHMHLQEVEELGEDQAREVTGRAMVRMGVRDDPAVVLRMLHERTGLYVGPGSYSFAHKSIGEYLVAEAVVQGDRVGDDGKRVDQMRLYRERHNDRWRTVMFLWAGLAPVQEVEGFLGTVAERLDREEVGVLGGLLHDQAKRIPVASRRDLLERILRAPIEASTQTYYQVSVGGGYALPLDAPPLLSLSFGGHKLDRLLGSALARGDLPIQWPQDGLSDVAAPILWVAMLRALAGSDVRVALAWATNSPCGGTSYDWAVAGLVYAWLRAGRGHDALQELVESLGAHDPHAYVSATLSLMEEVALDKWRDPVLVLKLMAFFRLHIVGQVLLRERLAESRDIIVVDDDGGGDIVDLLAAFEAFLLRGVEGLDDATRDECLALTRHLRAARDG